MKEVESSDDKYAKLSMYVSGPLSKKHSFNWLTLAYYGALDQENEGACGLSNTIMEAEVLIGWLKEREKGITPRWSKENEQIQKKACNNLSIVGGQVTND